MDHFSQASGSGINRFWLDGGGWASGEIYADMSDLLLFESSTEALSNGADSEINFIFSLIKLM